MLRVNKYIIFPKSEHNTLYANTFIGCLYVNNQAQLFKETVYEKPKKALSLYGLNARTDNELTTGQETESIPEIPSL